MRVNNASARRCAPPEPMRCAFANSRGRRVRLVVSRDGLGDQSEPRAACAWGCRRARLALGDHPECAGCARCGRDQRIGLVERSSPPARRHATCSRDRRTYRDMKVLDHDNPPGVIRCGSSGCSYLAADWLWLRRVDATRVEAQELTPAGASRLGVLVLPRSRARRARGRVPCGPGPRRRSHRATRRPVPADGPRSQADPPRSVRRIGVSGRRRPSEARHAECDLRRPRARTPVG